MSTQLNTVKPAIPNNTSNMFKNVRLVQAAMNEHHRTNFDEWSNDIFAGLVNPYDPDGASLNTHSEFFGDLLLFLADPELLAQFNKEVANGLRMIKILSSFFLELQRKAVYEEFITYHSLRHFYEEDWEEFKGFAKQYLTSDDLQKVLADETDPD